MNTELKKTKDSIDELNEMMRSAMRTIQFTAGFEDDMLDIIERTFKKYYKSSGEEDREVILIIALEMCVGWNNMVDELGDSTFHKDALAKRFLKIIWEE